MAVFYAKMSDIFYNMANSPTHSIPKVIHYNDSVEPFAVRHEIILGDREDWTYDPCDFLSIEDVSSNSGACHREGFVNNCSKMLTGNF
jgi:hypothetical protein